MNPCRRLLRAGPREALAPLYGVEAFDPAARDLVGTGVSEKRAADVRMVFMSYETFRALRLSGLSNAQLTRSLQERARALLVG